MSIVTWSPYFTCDNAMESLIDALRKTIVTGDDGSVAINVRDLGSGSGTGGLLPLNFVVNLIDGVTNIPLGDTYDVVGMFAFTSGGDYIPITEWDGEGSRTSIDITCTGTSYNNATVIVIYNP